MGPASTSGGLPRVPAELTAAWFDAALGDGDGSAVHGARIVHTIAGSATKVFVRLEPGPGAPAGLPGTVCVKGVFDEPRGPVRTFGATQEACFFRDLAPTLEMPLFRTWFAGAEADQGVVVFDDLRESHTFTEVAATWTADRVAAALEAQAAWHAATYGLATGTYEWLPSGNQVLGVAAQALFAPEHWTAHFADPTTVEVSGEFADRDRMAGAIDKLFVLHGAREHALSHGDAHIGNTYLDGAGRPGFYDWQTFCLAPPLDDASYFLGSALSTTDRRAHERELLGHYLDALAGHGGPRLDSEQAWLDYRRLQVHGFFWAVLPTAWQPATVSVPMAQRYIAAIGDHDSLRLLDEMAV